MMNSQNHPLIVADIGGTNARFGVAHNDSQLARHQLSNLESYRCEAFSSVEELISTYLETLGTQIPPHACLSVAAPVYSNQIDVTNRDWKFSTSGVRRYFGFDRLEVINDFAALANAVPYLKEDELITINPGQVEPDSNSTIAVMGPGTGFGLSIIVPRANDCGLASIVSTEGGHMGFSPSTYEETTLHQMMSEEHGRVNIENFLSGRGLEQLYRYLGKMEGRSLESLSASEITATALATPANPLAERCLQVFCGALGSVASDIALCVGARRGIYLGGGILPRLSGYLLESEFLKRFMSKTSMSAYVSDIPIFLVSTPQASLIGAAIWFTSRSG